MALNREEAEKLGVPFIGDQSAPLMESQTWDVRFSDDYINFLRTTDDTRLLVSHSDNINLAVRLAVARNPNMPPAAIHKIVTGKGERKVTLKRGGYEYETLLKVKREKDLHVLVEYAKNLATADITIIAMIKRVLAEEPYEPPFFDGTNWRVRPEQEVRRELLLAVLNHPAILGKQEALDVLADDEDDMVSRAAMAQGGRKSKSPEETQASEWQLDDEESRELQGVFENPFISDKVKPFIVTGGVRLDYVRTYRADEVETMKNDWKSLRKQGSICLAEDGGDGSRHVYASEAVRPIKSKLSVLPYRESMPKRIPDDVQIVEHKEQISDDLAFLLDESRLLNEEASISAADAKLFGQIATNLMAESQDTLAQARKAELGVGQPKMLGFLKLGKGKHQFRGSLAERQQKTLEQAAMLREEANELRKSHDAIVSRMHGKYPRESIGRKTSISPSADPQMMQWWNEAQNIGTEIESRMTEAARLESEATGIESVAAGTSGGLALESSQMYEQAMSLRAKAEELRQRAIDMYTTARSAHENSESARRQAAKYDRMVDKYEARLSEAQKSLASRWRYPVVKKFSRRRK
jgi:hypothetical protein